MGWDGDPGSGSQSLNFQGRGIACDDLIEYLTLPSEQAQGVIGVWSIKSGHGLILSQSGCFMLPVNVTSSCFTAGSISNASTRSAGTRHSTLLRG